jgi:NAD(P)H-hydrate epimerase
MPSLTRNQTRAIDRFAIERLGVPGVVLMENAGRLCADAVGDFLHGPAGRKVAICAGGGNNGGDGFVMARHLSMRGAEVAIFLLSPAEKLSGDAEINYRIARNLGLDIREVGPAGLAGLSKDLSGFDVVVDAIGGTGICGALRGDIALAVEQINAAARPVVAVDIPTGLDCDTGKADGPAVRAKLTVTMVARKKGFDAPESAEFTGEVRVVDIGIPAEVVERVAGREQ